MFLLSMIWWTTQCVYLQMVLEDQGNLSLHAVQADQRYRADQPNPGGLRGLRDPERNDYAYNFYVQKKKQSPKYTIFTPSVCCKQYLIYFFSLARVSKSLTLTLNPLTPVLLLFYCLHACIVACFIGLLFFHLLPFVVLVCHFCHLGQA